MQKTDLSAYNNANFKPGGNALKRFLWFYVNAVFFKTSLLPLSGFKAFILRLFGATIGSNVTFKPCINIKYPWHLSIGSYTWIGENVWLDCLVPITIGSNVCISQGAVLITGSHNYKKSTFDLITGTIVLEDGVWIGAAAIINHSITVGTHAVLTSGSVATGDLEAHGIYQGNPAVKIRVRQID
jgi:putative colanic acid biosynthesis acetyltransferase WcaF